MLKAPHKIVIIDDENQVLEVIASVVDNIFSEQVEIACFTSSTEAWDYIQHHEVRIVLTDLHLPQIHGLDLIKKLVGLNRGIQVIAITGDRSCSVAFECFMNGVHGYLSKPATMQNIELAFNKCFETLNYWKDIIESSQEI